MININDIKWRIGSTGINKNGDPFATCLIYIDARTAMNELDRNVGVGNWQFDWLKVDGEKWAVRGLLKIRQEKEWIEYSDVGYPQDAKTVKWSEADQKMVGRESDETEWLKDAISDSLKRCALYTGIGRELYDAPFLYTEEVIVNKHGKVSRLTDMGNNMIKGLVSDWYKKLPEVSSGI